MKATKWIWTWAIMIAIGIAGVMLLNYYIDPLWCFGQKNRFSNIRSGFNERQQKTNYLYHTKEQYNTLLLGSSRTTYLAPEYFKKLKVFNYAANNMLPSEYLGYIDNYTVITGKAPEVVILGLDFWGTSSNTGNNHQEPRSYLDQRKKWSYIPSKLASIDALQYSVNNIKYSFIAPPLNDAYYNNKLTKLEYGQTSEFKEQRMRTQIKHYKEEAYGAYVWDTSYASTLQQMVDQYPETKFIVFTTPIREPLYYLLVNNNLTSDHRNWLKVCVNIFGTVHHFMTPNKYSNTDSLFYDTQHFKPSLAKKYAPILEERIDWDNHIDHEALNRENLDSYLWLVEELFMIYKHNYKPPKPLPSDDE